MLQYGLIAVVLVALYVWKSGVFSDRPTAEAVKPLYEQGTLFLDVRSLGEWRSGHLQRAKHLPLDQIQAQAARVLPDRDQKIVIYCQSGSRSVSAERILKQLGYSQAVAMRGGIGNLARAGYPLTR